MILTEIKAEKFLLKNNFKIIKTIVLNNETNLEKEFNSLKKPIVMKISGKNIIHKKEINGVRLNITSLEQAKKEFKKLKKINEVEEIIIQEQIKGKEILLGVKKTDEFGQILVFGTGGSNVEKEKDVTFLIPPIEKIEEYIKKTKIGKTLNHKEISLVKKNILLLEKLCKKNPNINELDINPLIITNNEAIIVDARIVI